jgi:hypothetical protein
MVFQRVLYPVELPWPKTRGFMFTGLACRLNFVVARPAVSSIISGDTVIQLSGCPFWALHPDLVLGGPQIARL